MTTSSKWILTATGAIGFHSKHLTNRRLEPVATGWISLVSSLIEGGDARHHGSAGDGASTTGIGPLLKLHPPTQL